jgi:acetyl esterase
MRDEGASPLVGQLLIYPITDYYQPGTDSYREFASGFGLSRRTMAWFWHHYAPPEVAVRPEASPLRVPDLANLPPALVVIAECDPLVDEGRRYAERLVEAGNAVETLEYPGMIHGFFRALGIYPQADHAINEAGKWLMRQWRPADVPVITSEC